MKNVPRRDAEQSKLLPFGILNKKNPSPSFGVMRQEGWANSERFSEDIGQLMPKRSSAKALIPLVSASNRSSGLEGIQQATGSSPLRTEGNVGSSSNAAAAVIGGLKSRNKSPNPNELLVRMGYGVHQPNTRSALSMSMSLLSSQREKHILSQQQQQLHTSPTKSKMTQKSVESSQDQQQNSTGSLMQSVLEGDLLKKVQRFLDRCGVNSRIRNDFAKSLKGSITEEVCKKVEHLDSLHRIMEDALIEVIKVDSNSYHSEGTMNTMGVFVSSILEKYVQLSAYVMNLTKTMQNCVVKASVEVKSWQEIAERAEEKVANVVAQKEQIQETLKEKNAQLKKYIEMGEGSTDAGEFRSKKEKRENYITFENQKLAAENSQLAEKLKVLETGADITNLRESLAALQVSSDERIKKILDELEFKDREIQRRKLLIQSLSASLSKMELEVRSLRAKVEDQENQLFSLTEKNNENETKYYQFRERALMQKEDYHGLIQKTSDQLSLLNTLREKQKALKQKLDRFIISRSKEVEIPNDGSFPNDLNMLQVISGEFSRDKSYFKHALAAFLPKNNNSDGAAGGSSNNTEERSPFENKYASILTSLIDRPSIGDSVVGGGNVNSNTVSGAPRDDSLISMQISKPNFYIFIEQAAKNYELDMQNMKSRKISLAFLGNMRAILDSKYHEMLLFEATPRQVSKFPDFVYSWLGKFTIDSVERQLRLLTEAEKNHADDSRVIFLLDLVNPKLTGVWEIVTFKEFLNEKAAVDEVFFYLHCRNLLLKGPSTHRHESTFDVYQYVSVERAEQLVDVIMVKYDPVNVMLIKKQLREKIKLRGEKKSSMMGMASTMETSTTTGGGSGGGGATNSLGSRAQNNNTSAMLIEAGFVLRILLEFYRIEKRNRYKLMREAFLASSSIGASGKFCISFSAYKKIIMVNYTEATEQEIAEIYREAYSLGNGSVTVDVFQTIANDTGFFLRYLQLNSFVKNPQLDESGNLADIESNTLYAYFYNMMDQMKSIQDVLLQEAIRLGVDRIYDEVEDINYQINHKFQSDVGDLRGKPFVMIVHRIMSVWHTLKVFRLFRGSLQGYSNHASDASTAVAHDVESMTKILKEVERFDHARKVLQIEKSAKLRKLQKMCRQKISKFYSFVSSLLSAKLKASVRQQQQQLTHGSANKAATNANEGGEGNQSNGSTATIKKNMSMQQSNQQQQQQSNSKQKIS